MKLVSSLVLLLALASRTTATAQETTTGTITGRIVDAQNLGVPGAAVMIGSDQGTRTFTSDADGRFFAPFLTPGLYTVRVELQGFRPIEQKDVDVRLGQRVDLSLKLEVGGLAEAIEVSAASPVVDTSTTAAGVVLSSDMLARVPVGRRFSDTLYIAPGVSSGGATGSANPSIAGGSGLENQFIVDGVNITNAGYGALGSYSIVFGSLGNGVTFDFIKEVQVKTAGFEAEFGQSTGGVVNIVTKSGSNNLKGTAFGYFRPEALEGDFKQVDLVNGVGEPLGSEQGITSATSSSDVGIQIGGPILRDRAFFIGAINPQWETRTMVAPEAFPLHRLGEVDRDRQVITYSAKGTLQLNSNHRIDASVFGDPAKGDNGPQRGDALLATNTAKFSNLKRYGGHNQVVKYDGVVNSHWLIEASYGQASNKIEEIPSVDEWLVEDRTGPAPVFSGGIGFFEVGNDGVNQQYQVKSTHIVGDHQIRYGVQFEDISYDNIIDRTGPSFRLANGQQTVTGAEIIVLPDPTFGRIYRAVRGNTSNVRETSQEYLNVFVQDTWKIGNRLTIRPGLRYEQQKLVGNLADFRWDNNWGPRIGASYDPIGNGRAKIYGNWGRFYAKVPNDLAARALSADAGLTRAEYFDAGLTQPVPDGVLALGTTSHLVLAGSHASDFDPESKSTYLDETLVGVEYEALPGLNLGVRFVHRNMPRVLEDVGTAAQILYFVPSGLQEVSYFITNPENGYPATAEGIGAFEEPVHRYDAIELTADKRFSNNWSLQASYRWSRLHGTFEGFFRNDNGQSDPAITSLYDFPTNDPSYTAIGTPEFGFRGDIRFLGKAGEGPLPNDRRHQGKLFGNYVFANGLNIGAGLALSSGRPLTPMAANPAYDSRGEIPEAPRGSGIETVDGLKTRSPAEVDFDIHLDYGIHLRGAQRLVLLADVFNLFDLVRVRDYDQDTETNALAPNADFGRVIAYQVPRQVRLGVRFEF